MDRKLKLKVINKLMDAGYDDEKKVMGFSMKDMLYCDIRGEEIGVVLELQEATKAHKVISFLADEKQEEPASTAEPEPDTEPEQETSLEDAYGAEDEKGEYYYG